LEARVQKFQRLHKENFMNLEQFKQKYAAALEAVQNNNVRLDHLHVQDGRFFMQGAAPNENAKNRVWDAIKSADPTYSDLTCDLTIDSSLPAPASASSTMKYTVQPGDSLSKIAKHFYGDANSYMKIFDANKNTLDDPNKIQPGQQLLIPAA
jgi:nucleoid-associated protein YgaU